MFQEMQLAGDFSRTSTVRFFGLGFDSYDRDVPYAAYLCDLRADLLFLSRDMAVVRLIQRPKTNKKCAISFWDVRSGKRTFVSQDISFVEMAEGRAPAVAVDVVPSFYYADRKTAYTTVRITAPNLRNVTWVSSVDRFGRCFNVTEVEDGFTCMLPHPPPSIIDFDKPHFYLIQTPIGDTRFSVQALREDNVMISAASPATISTGARLHLELSRPLETAFLLPWVPVLVHKKSGEIEHGATFSSIRWSEDKMSMSAIVNCLACRPGAHDVHLGESVQGQAASVIPFTSAAVNIREPDCAFVRPALPEHVPVETLDAGAASIYLPVDLTNAPRARFTVHAGDDYTSLTATLLPAAGRASAILAVTPSPLLKMGNTFLTISSVDETTGRFLSTCTLNNAFSVERVADDKPSITSVSQRLFFVGDVYDDEVSVAIHGNFLARVRSVVLHFVSSSDPNAFCSDVEVNNGYITCTLRKSSTASRGKFDFVLADQYGMFLAKADGFYLLDGPVATFQHTEVKVGEIVSISATLDHEFPATIPVELVLVHADNTPLPVAVQWAEGGSAVFADAAFVSDGTAYIAYRELSATLTSLNRIPGLLYVVPGPRPFAQLAGVYPSHMQSSTLDGATRTVFHIDITNYHLVASEISYVMIGELRAYPLSTSGALIVSALIKTVPKAYDVVVFDKMDRELLFLHHGLTVEADAVGYKGAIALINSNYITTFTPDAHIASMKVVVRNGPADNWHLVNVTSSLGHVVRINATRYEESDDLQRVDVWVECLGCLTTGDQITLSFTFVGALPIHVSFLTLRAPTVRSLWLPDLIDFSAVAFDGCVPYAVSLDTVHPRIPLAVGLLSKRASLHNWIHPGIKSANHAVDVATSTFTGCLVCDNCVGDSFDVALSAPYTSADVMSQPTTRRVTIIPPGVTHDPSAEVSTEASVVVNAMTGTPNASKSNAGKNGNLSASNCGLVLSLSLVAVAVVGLLCWRWRRQAAAKTTSAPAIGNDALLAEAPFSAT